MALELTYSSLGSGRLPRVRGATVPSPGLKVKFGRFVSGTSQYNDDGYTAAEIAGLVGLTYVVAVLPCGLATNGTHEKGWPVGWDSSARVLRAYGIPAIDGNAQTGGATAAVSEVATNAAGFDVATFDAVVLGY